MKKQEEKLIKIGELAKLTRVLTSTIHFYTQQGLLRFAQVTPGGYRLYDREISLRRLRKIQDLQTKKRWTIVEIKKYFRTGN